MACAQRLCFCSSALPKPRPVPDTKRGTKITLIAYTSPRYCRSILLATCALLLSTCKSVVRVSSRCHGIELIVTVHGCPFVIHLLFVPETLLWNCTRAGGNLGESFSLLLLICPVLVRGCGTLGKGFGLCGWMCGLWQVCCLGRPHFIVRCLSGWEF